MDFTRKSVIKHLDEIRGLSPVDPGYRERVEQYILFHFNILEDELAEKKKFKSYCSTFVSKTKDYYRENIYLLDRMFEDESHKVFFAAPIPRPATILTGAKAKRSYDNVGAPPKEYEKKSRTGQYLEEQEFFQKASCSKVLLRASKHAMDAIGNKEGSRILNELSKDPNSGVEILPNRPGCNQIHMWSSPSSYFHFLSIRSD